METANREEVGLSFRTEALSNSRAFAYAKTNFFEQISLDSLEKKELVRLLGRPEDAAKNISVKAVCHDLPDDEEIKEYFLYFHQEHGMTKTYDTLRFLALLSLTADNIPLSRNLIVKKLPGDGTQRPVRGDVLAAYFDGKAPSLGFVRTQWTACIKTFKKMLIGFLRNHP